MNAVLEIDLTTILLELKFCVSKLPKLHCRARWPLFSYTIVFHIRFLIKLQKV